MRRVLVIGPCGSGKSTLARELAPRMGLPLTHMDQLGWQAGWVETDKAQLNARLAEVIAQDEWLIEGNYGSTLAPRLARADTVIHRHSPRPLAPRHARGLPRTLRCGFLLVRDELEHRPADPHRSAYRAICSEGGAPYQPPNTV